MLLKLNLSFNMFWFNSVHILLEQLFSLKLWDPRNDVSIFVHLIAHIWRWSSGWKKKKNKVFLSLFMPCINMYMPTVPLQYFEILLPETLINVPPVLQAFWSLGLHKQINKCLCPWSLKGHNTNLLNLTIYYWLNCNRCHSELATWCSSPLYS